MSLFLCLPGILLGPYCRKSPAKSWGFGKNIKGNGLKGEVVLEEGFKPAHCDIEGLKGGGEGGGGDLGALNSWGKLI